MSTCKQPDRDHPKMVCGYPIPCPWHTAVIDTTGGTDAAMTIRIPHGSNAATSPAAREHLREIGHTIKRAPAPPRKKGKRR